MLEENKDEKNIKNHFEEVKTLYSIRSYNDSNINILTGRAEMDNSETTDFQFNMNVEQKSTTTFLDGADAKDGTRTMNTEKASTLVETYADIKAFLAKPYMLADGVWSTSDAVNANLANGDISGYLGGVAMWARKVEGFNLIRGDFLIKVGLNASPFQQGKLLLHYLPNLQNFVSTNAGYEKFKNKHLVQKIQHPHLEVDCRDTAVYFRIPYIAPTDWYAVREGYYDWGRWYLDVFAALRTGAAAGAQTTVDYTVWGWWENVELAAPGNPQSNNKAIKRNVVQESKENMGPIESGLRKTAKVADVLSEIPLITNYAKTAEWVANIGANVAGVLGWSKPRELEGQNVMLQQHLRYAGTCDGPDVAYPGGISCLNRVEPLECCSFTNEDEMSLNYLYSVPYYYGSVNWDYAAGQGTSLLSMNVSPYDIIRTATDVVGAHTIVYEQHAPFTYLSRFHRYWRGNIDVTFKFVKTQMHSGRLLVSWLPLTSVNATPTLSTSAYCKRAIVDIRSEDTVTFTLPYMALTNYLLNDTSNFVHQSMGQLDVRVLNDLKSPESCASSIDIQVFFTPGEGFELAVPGTSLASSVPYIPQSNDVEIIYGEAQADGKELLSDANNQGHVMTDMEIGGTNTKFDSLFHAKRCIGEKMFSIKSYLLRNSVISGTTVSSKTWTSVNNFCLDPYFVSCQTANGSGVLGSTAYTGDAFSLLAPMYAYMRGGMRITFFDTTNTHIITSVVTPSQFDTFSTTPLINSPYTVNFYGPDNTLGSAGLNMPFEPCNTTNNNIVYQHVPYYNKFPTSLITYYEGTSSNATNFSKPNNAIVVSCGSGNFGTLVCLQRAVADDFQLSFFTGCPCLIRSYT